MRAHLVGMWEEESYLPLHKHVFIGKVCFILWINSVVRVVYARQTRAALCALLAFCNRLRTLVDVFSTCQWIL